MPPRAWPPSSISEFRTTRPASHANWGAKMVFRQLEAVLSELEPSQN